MIGEIGQVPRCRAACPGFVCGTCAISRSNRCRRPELEQRREADGGGRLAHSASRRPTAVVHRRWSLVSMKKGVLSTALMLWALLPSSCGWWRAALISLLPAQRQDQATLEAGSGGSSPKGPSGGQTKVEPAGAGVKGWLWVSMCQMASVSFRAMSIWATLAPAGSPGGACCAGSARRRPGGAGHAWSLRASPSAGTSGPVCSAGRGGSDHRTDSRAGKAHVAAELLRLTRSGRCRRSRQRW